MHKTAVLYRGRLVIASALFLAPLGEGAPAIIQNPRFVSEAVNREYAPISAARSDRERSERKEGQGRACRRRATCGGEGRRAPRPWERSDQGER